MIIKLFNTLLEIRHYVLTTRKTVEFTDKYSSVIWNFEDKSWELRIGNTDILYRNFTDAKKFVGWLNYQIENKEFEIEMEKILKLKAFI